MEYNVKIFSYCNSEIIMKTFLEKYNNRGKNKYHKVVKFNYAVIILK
jgi:hypothetical protein